LPYEEDLKEKKVEKEECMLGCLIELWKKAVEREEKGKRSGISSWRGMTDMTEKKMGTEEVNNARDNCDGSKEGGKGSSR